MKRSYVRTLLIGASGQLGRALAVSFADHAVLGTALSHLRGSDVRLDLGDTAAIRSLLDDTRPEVVLIAGAMCHVDLCETEPALCERINTRGPEVVAEYARQSGARVVLYSTDHVFDGTAPLNSEDDTVHPLSVYARSKARAEERLRSLVPDRHLILRTSWVYGPDWQRRNFILRLVDALRAGQSMTMARDQWGSPTLTLDLAAATRDLLDRGIAGTFHATGPDLLSREQLAEQVCAALGLDPRHLVGRTTADLRQAAPRPLRIHLDNRKLRGVCDVPFRGVAEGLRALQAAGEI